MNSSKVWKRIDGYPDYYVSDHGDVFSKRRNRILTPQQNLGNIVVKLTNMKIPKTWLLNRLVASAFLPNSNNLPIVIHKDGNKFNNHKDNLEWSDRIEICQNARAVLAIRKSIKKLST